MVFAAVVSRLPAQLREAMEESQLIDPGLLRHYPRTCWRLLGLGASPVQRTTMVMGISSASQAGSEAVRLVGTGCESGRARDLPEGRVGVGKLGASSKSDDGSSWMHSALQEDKTFEVQAAKEGRVGAEPKRPRRKTGKTSQEEGESVGTRVSQLKRESAVPEQAVMSSPAGGLQARLDPPEDIVVLYHTLVRDQALPPGFEEAFSKLAPHISIAAKRQQGRLADTDNPRAALHLHELKKQDRDSERRTEVARAQFLLAAARPPRRYVSRLQRAIYQGPNARQETEDAERVRWVRHLAELLVHSSTPMGETLRERPGDTSLLGAGRRVSTLRSRVRAVRRFVAWLGANHNIAYPTALEQLLEYLRVRLSEPCNRGSLRNAHEALVFLEEAAAVPTGQKFTGMSLYAVGYKELLSRALPGAPVKQAPRMYTTMLAGLEEAVLDSSNAVYSRIYSWWILVQTWCTLRFSDHRGISPRDVKVRTVGSAETIGDWS